MSNKTLAIISGFLLTFIVAYLSGERKNIIGINQKKNNDLEKKKLRKK